MEKDLRPWNYLNMKYLLLCILILAHFSSFSYAYNERYQVCTETVHVTQNDFVISPLFWSTSDNNCTTRLERGLFENNTEIVLRVFKLVISSSMNYGCIDKIWFSYPDSGVTTTPICRRQSIPSIFQAVGTSIDIHLESSTLTGQFEINLSVAYVKSICEGDFLDLRSATTGYLKTKNYPLYDEITCSQIVHVNPGQRLYFSFLDQKLLGCDTRANCDSDGYLRLNGECGCTAPILLSELHDVRLEYANKAVKPGRMVYFEVYGCKISDMELINANAAMIAGTYKADVQCYVGNYMSQETMENTVINICDFNTETWSIQSIKCAPVDCGEPPIVANGTIRHKITDTTFNAIARYRCDYSFIMAAGNLKIQCLENGDWEMAPQCEFTNTTMSREEYDRLWFTTEVTIGDGTENEHTTKEGAVENAGVKSSKVGGIVGAVVGILVILIMIILITLIFHKKKNNKKRNLHSSYTGQLAKERHKARVRNSRTVSSSRPYDAWEASLTTKQQPATIRIQRVPDATTLRRMSDVLSSETWKTAASGTLRINDPTPRPSVRPYHATVSGRMRSSSRVALMDNDFYVGREIGTFRAKDKFSIHKDLCVPPKLGVHVPTRRLPVPTAFRNDAAVLSDDYDTANDARTYAVEPDAVYDLTPATNQNDSEYDYVDADSDFESDNGDKNHNQIIDLSNISYSAANSSYHQPTYDLAYS